MRPSYLRPARRALVASTTVEISDGAGDYLEVEYSCVDCTPRDAEIELSCFAKILRRPTQFTADERSSDQDDDITLATLIREYAATERLSLAVTERKLEEKLIECVAEKAAEDYDDAAACHGDYLYEQQRDRDLERA